ncbi:MAG: response regulator [Anaerolineae bacterium]|nr:response regulator [Anaerolineae bacterium]
MPTIMIVDDDPDFVEIARLILEPNGYETVSACNGDQALRSMRQSPPDLVVLDVMMSTVLDGVHLSHEMQADPNLKNIPVIMVSSILDSPHAEMFPTDEYIPMNAWITKPIDPNELLEKVAQLLNSDRGR